VVAFFCLIAPLTDNNRKISFESHKAVSNLMIP